MVESSMPKQPISIPLRMSLERLAMMARPKVASAKYSAGPNLSAICASMGAMKASTIQEKKPPMPDEMVAMPKAFIAWPFWASG